MLGLAPGNPSLGVSRGAQSQASASPQDSSETPLEPAAGSFTARLRNGQSKFRQGETITVELEYSTGGPAALPAPANDEHKWLIVDGLHLEPRLGSSTRSRITSLASPLWMDFSRDQCPLSKMARNPLRAT
jgi:hypothetical protein